MAYATRIRDAASIDIPGQTTILTWNRIDPDRKSQQKRVELITVLVGFVLICIVYLGTCGTPALFDQIDGQYAGAAREMMARGDWVIPTQDGVPRLQKPPLVYWLEIFSLHAFGINEFAARFPVALATVAWFCATVLIVYRITRRAIAGWTSALILATSMGSFFFTHLVMTEPFVALFMAMTMWCLISALQCNAGKERDVDRWLLFAWLFISLGSLSKGLHSLVFPVLVAGLSAWFKPPTRPVWRRFLLRPHGWILFLILAAPWYITTEVRYPGFLVDHFWNEQVGHVFNRRWPPDSERVPLLLFWAEHLVLLFPWTLFLPAWICLRRQSGREDVPQQRGEAHILCCWFLVNAVGITLSSLQDYYLLVSWPVLAFCCANVFVNTRRIARSYYAIPGLVLALIGVVGVICSFWIREQTLAGDGIATPAVGWTILSAFEQFPADLWRGLEPFLWINSAAALVAGLLIVFFGWRRQVASILAVLAIFMGVVFGAGARGMALVQDEFSSAKVVRIIETAATGNGSTSTKVSDFAKPSPFTKAAAVMSLERSVNRSARPDYQVICDFESNDLTSLFFYLPHRIFWVNAHPETEFATRALKIGRDLYLDEEQLQALWRGPEQVFLVVKSASLNHWKQVLVLRDAQSQPVGRCASRVVLTNRLKD
jgi:4-amino-4-deoxy-L-arabinose transferase-like glycosyltransferase